VGTAGAAGVRNGVAAQTGARGLNTQGGSTIFQPAGQGAASTIGAGSTVIGTPSTTVGGSVSGNTFISPPGGIGTAAAQTALPANGLTANQQLMAVTALPVQVQSALQSMSANGQVANITQAQGVNGLVYQASVTENGVPVNVQISPTGQILSRTPATGAGLLAPNNVATVNSQAGLPLSTLPTAVQSGIQGQLGANTQVQTISRDDLANGTVYRVTTTQNGIPTEMRFAANGTFLGTAPLNGTLTSSFVPSAAVLPGTAVGMSDIPASIQSAIRSQVGNGRLNQVMQQPGTNGVAYAVSYDLNGRPMVMTVGPDGRIISNNPISSVGNPAGRSSGTGTSTNTTARTNATTRTSMRLDQLPDPVQQTLKKIAPLAEVRSITREERVGGDVYTVSVRSDNSVGDLVIGSDGRIVSDNRRNFAEFSVPRAIVDDEKAMGIPFSRVPVAIQDAISAYATASDIRSITLGTDKDARPVYDVVFYRDGRRDRMIITKDGTLRRIEQNVPPTYEIPNPNKAPVFALGDLPQSVQDTIRRQTDKALIKDIGTRRVGSETIYQVHYETNGAPVELLVSTDGRVVFPQGSLEQETSNSPSPAPIATDEIASARVIEATPTTLSNTGTAAGGEQGSSQSGITDTIGNNAAKVNLTDVPSPVQNTANKLAGNATIDSITPKLGDSGVAYEVTYEHNGGHRTVVVNKDGVVVKE